jgi:chromosomal replication initiation ATPase DnaA
MRDLGRCSLTEIGRHLGGRDHSTVLSGYRRIEAELASLPQTKAAVDELTSLIHKSA